MGVNRNMKEKLSALSDGELSDFETRRLLDEIDRDPELIDFWNKINLVKDLINKSELTHKNIDISEYVKNELSLKKLTKESSHPKQKKDYNVIFGSAIGGFTLVIAMLFLPPFQEDTFSTMASKEIASSIASPQAIDLLNKSLEGVDVRFKDFSYNREGKILANFIDPTSGNNFKISLSPLTRGLNLNEKSPAKLAYIKTTKGTYIISVSGNITDEKKAKILQNASFVTINR
tara:strand:- start:36308 stop:37003 length:696 start_codon:yes stop_codon:yes gene_type:complete